jgi:hypothetical protein
LVFHHYDKDMLNCRSTLFTYGPGVEIGSVVGVAVGSSVDERVGEGLVGTMSVPVGVEVITRVGVLVGMTTWVEVGVFDGPVVGLAVARPTVISNWGPFAPPSRLTKLTAVLLLPVNARLKVPLPVIRGVISTVVQTPPLKAPIEPARLPNGGALL